MSSSMQPPQWRPKPTAGVKSLLGFAAVVAIIMGIPIGISAALPMPKSEVVSAPVEVGDTDWKIVLTTADRSPVVCPKEGLSLIASWQCDDVAVYGQMFETPEDTDLALRRTVRAALQRDLPEGELKTQGDITTLALDEQATKAYYNKAESGTVLTGILRKGTGEQGEHSVAVVFIGKPEAIDRIDDALIEQ